MRPTPTVKSPEETIAPGGGASSARIDLIDALRGFALLGILWINLPGHAFSFFALWDPYEAGGSDPLNVGVWSMSAILVDGAMRGLFSMLFGVGVVLQTKSHLTGAQSASTAKYYSRYSLLIVFGLAHGFLLLMPGDILYTYGFVALFLYPLRGFSSRTLVIAAASALALLAGLASIDAWELSQMTLDPIPDLSFLAYSGYFEILPVYAAEYASWMFGPDFIGSFLDAFVMMTLGMALMKSGIFTDAAKFPKLAPAAALLILTGIVLRAWVVQSGFDHDFEGTDWRAAGLGEIARPMMALGYGLAFIALWRAGALRWAVKSLTALGRMALTNYLAQTILTIFIFYGFGLGLHGALDRVSVIAIIVAIWIFQIFFSRLWLAHMGQGPVERLWRAWSARLARLARLAGPHAQ